jgi:hypothetical protein
MPQPDPKGPKDPFDAHIDNKNLLIKGDRDFLLVGRNIEKT